MMQFVDWLKARYLIIKRAFGRERYSGKEGFLLPENADYLYRKFWLPRPGPFVCSSAGDKSKSKNI